MTDADTVTQPISLAGSVSSKSSNDYKSSSVESSSFNTAETPKSTNTKAHKLELSGRETRYVNRLRYLVLAVLILVAAGVSCLVYFLVELATGDGMSSDYDRIIGGLTTAFENIRTNRIATLASLAVAAVAHGDDHDRSWPFVSLSAYQQRAFVAKTQSGVLQVSIAPLVTHEHIAEWEKYVVSDEADVNWIEDSISNQQETGYAAFIDDYGTNFRDREKHSMKTWSGGSVDAPVVPVSQMRQPKEYHIPFWQMSPFLSYDEVNLDMIHDARGKYALQSIQQGSIVVGDLSFAPIGGMDSEDRDTSIYARLMSISANKAVEYQGGAISNIFIPIFDSFKKDRRAKAVVVGLFDWGAFFQGALPPSLGGIYVVLHNDCYESFTYFIDLGGAVVPVGRGDLHDPNFDHMRYSTNVLQSGKIADGTNEGLSFGNTTCYYGISIYPSQAFVESFESNLPAIVVTIIVFVFLFTIVLFLLYDRLVEHRQNLVLQKALQSTAIVSSLFPQNVRDRIMQSAGKMGTDQNETIKSMRHKMSRNTNTIDTSNEYFTEMEDGNLGETIADLFPNCTVLFADIAGFTAWSSSRSPEQVFTLLQNIYKAFDKIAARRRVFKVETIGDSYVAVTGLPDPQPDHALIMAKFARECLERLMEVTQALELLLGPDTTELSMRFGLNSGQVTGGVLMGDRARFQLFGDTVNTAARMESTGIRGKIQLSQSTAELLIAAGKENWVSPRDEEVTAKGKGTMQTFWLEPKRSSLHHPSLNKHLNGDVASPVACAVESLTKVARDHNKNARLIGWMSEVLIDYVKQIVAKNKVLRLGTARASSTFQPSKDTICLDELVQSFDLLWISKKEKQLMREEYLSVQLSKTLVDQVQMYVKEIASLYVASNPFHNFDHACHVTMSVHKLMKRVVSDGTYNEQTQLSSTEQEKEDTYGILTSDPLTLFAIVFSALIHDVDHRGVSNVQLAKEAPELGALYRSKSIAEQNSYDISWDLLMSDSFKELRQVIFPRQSDLLRFRQVSLNIVLATDIFDKQMNDMRKERWRKVFEDIGSPGSDSHDVQNTRATIVLEHIIQASDVSHTMQHWHVYLKWNKRLFEEMSLAHEQGRMGSDPAAFWYEGELSFFDDYVIPLAKKIGQCGVFGVSSDEYLNYALSNRQEWEIKGKKVVEELVGSRRLKDM